MIISLTGTPGTGKTSVAEKLEEKGFQTIDLTEFAKTRELGEQKQEFEVDTEKMVEELKEEISDSEDTAIEGHLSHNFPADYCVVLRCRPKELEERLKQRDYSQKKIQENVEAEVLDIILQQAATEQKKIIEINTTDRKAGEVAEEILEKIENDETGYGNIDWTEYL